MSERDRLADGALDATRGKIAELAGAEQAALPLVIWRQPRSGTRSG